MLLVFMLVLSSAEGLRIITRSMIRSPTKVGGSSNVKEYQLVPLKAPDGGGGGLKLDKTTTMPDEVKLNDAEIEHILIRKEELEPKIINENNQGTMRTPEEYVYTTENPYETTYVPIKITHQLFPNPEEPTEQTQEPYTIQRRIDNIFDTTNEMITEASVSEWPSRNQENLLEEMPNRNPEWPNGKLAAAWQATNPETEVFSRHPQSPSIFQHLQPKVGIINTKKSKLPLKIPETSPIQLALTSAPSKPEDDPNSTIETTNLNQVLHGLGNTTALRPSNSSSRGNRTLLYPVARLWTKEERADTDLWNLLHTAYQCIFSGMECFSQRLFPMFKSYMGVVDQPGPSHYLLPRTARGDDAEDTSGRRLRGRLTKDLLFGLLLLKSFLLPWIAGVGLAAGKALLTGLLSLGAAGAVAAIPQGTHYFM